LHSDYISNEEISTYFSAADVVVLPYISATQSAIVPVAYHFNKPVIVTNVGGLAEVVTNGRTGFIVPPQNPKAFADAVVKFYHEKCESGFALNIQKEKKQYDWNTFIERLESLFEPKN
jgi:glycosyltransferase involved in cell wall biosynthesis